METKRDINGIFPSLNDSVEAECTIRAQDILPLPVMDIEKFCHDTGIATSLFIRTVWLVVMWPFLEIDRICIGYRDYRDSSPHLASGPEKVIQSDILPDASLIELLKSDLGTEPEDLCAECPPAHNTAIALIREISESDQSKFLMEAEKWNYSIALVGEVNELSALVRLSLVHKSSALSPCLAENISSTVLKVVQEILADSNRRIMDLALFSELNCAHVLRWNLKNSRGPATSLIEMIHQHACERPHHPAICAWDGVLSYSEFDSLTTRWATRLQSLGIGPQSMVPVMMTNPRWMTVAEIAIMKAGGAFVPLEPTQPTSRLQDMVRQLNSTVALASPDVVPILSSLVDNVVIVSAKTTSSLPNAPSNPQWPKITPDTTAYVLFTSGSTGKPKGCVVCHGALENVEYQSQALRITAESRVLQFASHGFAASLMEVHCSLAVGATVCIPSKEDCMNGLNSAIDSMQVNWAVLTPSAALSLATPLGSLKTLAFAGEPMRSDLFHKLADEVDMLLVYASTEWAGVCVSQPIRSATDIRCIGPSPTGNLWLVDPTDHSRLAPVGAVGEVLIESPGLAKGYLNNESQTASTFIDPPRWLHAMASGTYTKARLYKTGDLAQYYADGKLRYIGRKSTQVKIRGKRLELGEVEYQIRQTSPSVEKVIVEAAAPKGGDTPIVVAFLYSQDQPALLLHFQAYVDTIKETLEKTLPDHMWPSIYLPLESVPLTRTGKTDRKALRQIISTSTRQELQDDQTPTSPAVAPVTELETKLHQLFAEILNIESSSFGINHSFIRLGGDSISAMRLANRCSQMGYSLTMQDIVQEQTVANLALQLDWCNKTNASSTTPVSKQRATERPVQRVSESVLLEEFIIAVGVSISATDRLTDYDVDSTMATKFADRINRRLGINITVEEVFQFPTIAALAKGLESQFKGFSLIPKTPYTGPVVQSFAQGRLWFLDQLHPGSTWYALPFAIRLRGQLDLAALEVALNAVVERHETLRTTFEDQHGLGVQVVHSFEPKQLKIVDMTISNNQDICEALQREQRTAFNLKAEPGWRPLVYRLGADDHVLSIFMHHIISDGWSLDILQKELNVFYSAAIRGLSPLSQIDPLSTNYRDFSVWQRQQEDENQSQVSYWIREIEGSKPAELLCDKPRPSILSGDAGLQAVDIRGALYRKLKLFCKAHQVTAYTVLLAAFRAAQYRLTGAEDVIIGAPFASRHHQELEPLIGFFVNLQCIRTKVEHACTTFYQLVQQIQGKLSMAFDNQDLPFEKLVSKLTEERDISRNPLVQIVFAVHSQSDSGKLAFEGVEAQRLTLSSASRFDMEFHFYQAEDSFRGEILFSLDLFHPETISMLHLVFIDILEHGLAQPTTPIDLMPFTNAKSSLEKYGLLEMQKTDYPRESSIVDVFQRQVRCCPDKVAVKDCSTQLTYHELDSKSDQVALFLTNRSLAPETVIGVFADRGCETITAFLGILKANLAYLPLDVKSPVSRLDIILSSTQACGLILLGGHIEPPSISLSHPHFISISDILATTVQAETPSPHAVKTNMPSAESVAYVVYSSGSTGIPKGIIMQHKAIVRLTQCSNIITHDHAATNIAHMSNIAFDMSVWEIYTALLNGGTLICIDRMTVLDYRLLAQAFDRERIQVAMITPAMLKQCLVECASIISQLEILFAGGDRLDPSDAIQARALVRGELINAYGPTENGVVSTIYSVPEKGIYPHGVPIGKPISNSGAYVMDAGNQLVPVGVIGELVVTGDGLAKGYIDSRLDADRFVMLDLPGQLPIRAYRTGDLVRYRPTDGHLEYFGRMDQQVKIRGHRVELAEIDQSLLGHDFIQDAVTIFRQETAQDPELVSFVTISEGEDLHLAEVETQDDAEKVEAWKDLFDKNIYDPSCLCSSKLGRDFVGWKSMYTGALIDTAEMSEWLDDAIDALLDGGPPGHVFEIGTGTGMILFNITAGLESYTALEPSSTAVDFVRAAVTTVPGLQGKVRLEKGTADNISNLDGPNSVDVAVINSVAQYFPSPEYLLKVVEDLVCLQGAKRIFLGDIRSYALYEEFQVSKALAGDRQKLLTPDDFRLQMAETVHMEEELLVDPAFFTSLPDRFRQLIEHVEILPKRMVATNELSCYRYAAVLHTKHRQAQPRHIHDVEEGQWVDFSATEMTHASLLEYLQQRTNDASVVAISNIPYRKTILERLIVDQLKGRLVDRVGGPGWLESLGETARQIPSLAPLDIIKLAEDSGFQVEISWARQYTQRGGLDVIFHRIQPDRRGSRVLFRFPNDHYERPFRQLSNNPLQQASNRDIGNWVRKVLQKELPPYMVPRMVRVLEQIPVNSNGKVDRKALASMAAVYTSQNTITARVNPHDDVERALLAEFTKVLGREIGISASFFDHGGHSLTAVKLVVGINQSLHTDVKVGDIFECPTAAGLAERIRSWRSSTHDVPASQNSTSSSAPFSLVGGSLPSAVTSELVRTGLNPTEVADVVPVTDTQAWFLNRWTPVSMRLNIHGKVDVNELRRACIAVIQKHSILRTVFMKLERRFVQVVLRAVNVPFTYQSVGGAIHDEADSGASDVPTKLFTKFELVSQSPIDHTFVVRLSHAQYDGFSLPLLFADLESAYNGFQLSPPIAVPFAEYVYRSAKYRSPEAFSFWKDYLRGSRLTTLSDPTLPGEAKATDVKAIVAGELPSPPPGTTLAILVNAAFAFTLAETAKAHDVTYGLSLNARGPIPGVETLLGPCFNRSPIRVQLQQNWTVLDLCRSLQESCTSASRHGYVELPDIIANCTNWSAGSDYGCYLNHFPTQSIPSFSFKDTEVVQYSMDGRGDLPHQLRVRSFVDERTWEIQVLTSSSVMSNEQASVLASRLLKTGQRFSQSPEVALFSPLLRDGCVDGAVDGVAF
ncbi:nonribosomal peptide synthase [Aspergillus costaricaensis CBS 115574]|uniref:Nonribosomal peptide synthase n=1 Tax=Aspergillus costaricaensis CBS 115574 TaxID=1448317 RepID=A0ACD1I7W3_9EURO|nr:nonribosomal peptide synthase [Aspergillus costaricaensis CBS 115574]RAK86365.1 nonribosomal peptide synthase [Aspergillus costaricaensis CBS 115574]